MESQWFLGWLSFAIFFLLMLIHLLVWKILEFWIQFPFLFFLSINRLIGLCLLQNELFPLFLQRHVLKYILGRTIRFHDLAFFDPVVFESLRQLVTDSTGNAASVLSDLELNFEWVLWNLLNSFFFQKFNFFFFFFYFDTESAYCLKKVAVRLNWCRVDVIYKSMNPIYMTTFACMQIIDWSKHKRKH